jgi:hypothetical protein
MGQFRADAIEDASRRVALFARCLEIDGKDRVDEGDLRVQPRPFPYWGFSGSGHRVCQCFAHHAAMDAELPRHALDCPGAVLVLTPDLLE